MSDLLLFGLLCICIGLLVADLLTLRHVRRRLNKLEARLEAEKTDRACAQQVTGHQVVSLVREAQRRREI